jgi:hypothetical protein
MPKHEVLRLEDTSDVFCLTMQCLTENPLARGPTANRKVTPNNEPADYGNQVAEFRTVDDRRQSLISACGLRAHTPNI